MSPDDRCLRGVEPTRDAQRFPSSHRRTAVARLPLRRAVTGLGR